MDKSFTAVVDAANVPPEFLVIGSLRDALKFRSREAMGRNWRAVFNDRMLPNDHETVEPETVIQFVTEISKPLRGRPGVITLAAQTLFDTFTPKQPKVKKPLDVVVGMIDDMNRTNGQQPDVSENIAPTATAQTDVSENIEQPATTPGTMLSETMTTSTTPNDVFANIETRFFDWLFGLTKLDVVFGFTIAATDYGLTTILKEMGVAAAVVYTLISLHALGMAKNRYAQQTARNGIVAVWLLEAGAFCVHLTMFNRRLWSSIDEMPFRVDDITDESRPFWIATVLALLFSAAGIYAVSTTLSLVIEKTDAENFENDHGRKY